jgi:hypothetical protein
MDSQTYKDYTCDGCNQPFSQDEWDERETPHEIYCVNFDGQGPHFECDCDRNYHSECYTWDEEPLSGPVFYAEEDGWDEVDALTIEVADTQHDAARHWGLI